MFLYLVEYDRKTFLVGTSARTKYISGRDVHPCFRYFARCSPYFARWSARGAHSARSAFEPAQRGKIGSFISQ